MARDNITDKGSGMQPPKSEWFGFKYRVTPETSKLLQEAVFKDGGNGWAGDTTVSFISKPYIFVYSDGELTYSDEEDCFERNKLPEKQPPQPVKVEPEKEFRAGKWYKCVDGATGNHALTEGNYYKCTWVSPDSSSMGVDSNTMKDSRGWMINRFDINSESDYDPNTAQPAGYTAYVVFKSEFTEGAIRKGEYDGKEYAYKCSRDDYTQYVELRAFDEDVFAEVDVRVVMKKVKVVRIEAKVDAKATRSIVRILPKELAKDLEDSTLGKCNEISWPEQVETYREKLDKLEITINRDALLSQIMTDFLTTKEESNMSNTQRKVVEVQLFDDAKGLPIQDSLVAKFDNVLTEDDNDTTIREVIMNNDIKKVLAAHNVKRSKVVNQDILERTGNSVALQPILLKDLRWKVIG